MAQWITPKDVENGIDGLPSISTTTQNNLRSKRKLTYTKIGTKVVYKKEWILEYLASNIKKAKKDKAE
ncbi:MAG: hypothetical protein JXQ68_05025 [Campylobacterales bacterium]|nr:hypothetical protein [Campylobacterales bacterium]